MSSPADIASGPINSELVQEDTMKKAVQAVAVRDAVGEKVVLKDGVLGGKEGVVVKALMRNTGSQSEELFLVSFLGGQLDLVCTENEFQSQLSSRKYYLVPLGESQTASAGYLFTVNKVEYYSKSRLVTVNKTAPRPSLTVGYLPTATCEEREHDSSDEPDRGSSRETPPSEPHQEKCRVEDYPGCFVLLEQATDTPELLSLNILASTFDMSAIHGSMQSSGNLPCMESHSVYRNNTSLDITLIKEGLTLLSAEVLRNLFRMAGTSAGSEAHLPSILSAVLLLQGYEDIELCTVDSTELLMQRFSTNPPALSKMSFDTVTRLVETITDDDVWEVSVSAGILLQWVRYHTQHASVAPASWTPSQSEEEDLEDRTQENQPPSMRAQPPQPEVEPQPIEESAPQPVQPKEEPSQPKEEPAPQEAGSAQETRVETEPSIPIEKAEEPANEAPHEVPQVSETPFVQPPRAARDADTPYGKETWVTSGVKLTESGTDISTYLQGPWVTLKDNTVVTVVGDKARFKVPGSKYGSEWDISSGTGGVSLLGCKLNIGTSTTHILRWEDGDVWTKLPPNHEYHPERQLGLHSTQPCSTYAPEPPQNKRTSLCVSRPNSAPVGGGWSFGEYKSKYQVKELKQLDETHLKQVFECIDVDNKGAISRMQLDSYFDTMDHIGVKCRSYVDRVLAQVTNRAKASDMISFDEFALVVLRMAAR